jgi:hypothetical protein
MNFFKIYPEHKFIHTWTTGSDSGSLLEFYKEVAAHSDFSKDFVGLADMRDASLVYQNIVKENHVLVFHPAIPRQQVFMTWTMKKLQQWKNEPST